MSITERIAEVTHPERKCGYVRTLEALSAEDRVSIEKALTSGSLSAYQLEGILRAEGHPTNRETIKRHQSGDCLCQSKTA